MSIIIFIVILLVLVLVHEAGHFFSAKFFGIRVDEFGFGFPPKIFGIKKGETEYSLNLLPIGGFVRIFGENPDEENTNGPDSARSFVNKPVWQQAIILFAGVFMNFLLAWFLFSLGFLTGLPTSVGSQPTGYNLQNVGLTIVSVLQKSPAEVAMLQSGDKIVSISSGVDTVPEINPDTLKSFVLSHGNQEIDIGYTRGKDQTIEYTKVTPVSVAGSEPEIGISMDEIGTLKLPFFTAIWQGLSLTLSTLKNTVTGLYGLIKEAIMGHGSLNDVTGPVGMVGIVGDAYKFGFVYLMSFAALISVNLAIVNLLPFPALDGGRLFFLLIEKIKGSRISPKAANTANMIGMGILLLLMVIITYHDVANIILKR